MIVPRAKESRVFVAKITVLMGMKIRNRGSYIRLYFLYYGKSQITQMTIKLIYAINFRKGSSRFICVAKSFERQKICREAVVIDFFEYIAAKILVIDGTTARFQ